MPEIINCIESKCNSRLDEDWGKSSSCRLSSKKMLGSSLYELKPGDFTCYHFHHGEEEILYIIAGNPILRTPQGEKQLKTGDYIHFELGAEGAHGLRNESDKTEILSNVVF